MARAARLSVFPALALRFPGDATSHSPSVRLDSRSQSSLPSLSNCCDYNGDILHFDPGDLSHPGDPNRPRVDANKRPVTRIQSGAPAFFWTVVCKRLADWEKIFHEPGRANTQIVHSNIFTEHPGGNEIAFYQVEGNIRVATGSQAESGQTSDFGPVSSITTIHSRRGGP
jgi:hypothetical protein